ncbi:substrate-binding domain-containing protein, partial [Akkermansiaceae bacterium]|nr:substrate-binding domain-containing protein [Akkermansiaceae bacterium]
MSFSKRAYTDRSKREWSGYLLMVSVLVTWSFLCLSSCKVQDSKSILIVHCAAGMRAVIEPASKSFTKKTGIEVQLNYGGSGELLSKLLIVEGDVYIPADSSYIQLAEKSKAGNLIFSSEEIYKLTPVVMLKQGSLIKVESIEDLLQPNNKLVLGDTSAAIGKLSHQIFLDTNLDKKLYSSLLTTQPTVNMVATQVAIGASDAAIVWDILQPQFPNNPFIPLEELEKHSAYATAAVLNKSKNRSSAELFVR